MKGNDTIDFLIKVFSEVTKEVGDSISFEKDKLLNRILEIVIVNFKAEACSIFLEKEDNKEEFVCVAGEGYANQIKGETYHIKEDRFTSFILRTKKPFNVKSKNELLQIKKLNNLNTEGKLDLIMWEKGAFKNVIAVPLLIRDRAIGLLKAENKKGDKHFSDEDFKTLIVTGHLITLATSHSMFYTKWKRSSQLEKIIEMIPDFLKDENKQELLNKIMRLTMDFFSAEVCFIFLRKEDDKDLLYCAEGAGYAAEVKEKEEVVYKLGVGDGLTGTIADIRQPVIINSVEELEELRRKGIAKSKADEHLKKRGQFRNMIGAPLIAKDKIVGVIKVENKKLNEDFTAYDTKALNMIADIAAITLDSLEIKQKSENEEDANSTDGKQKIQTAKEELQSGNLERCIFICLEIAKSIEDKENEKMFATQMFKYQQLTKQQHVTGDYSKSQPVLAQISYSVLTALDKIEEKIEKNKNTVANIKG